MIGEIWRRVRMLVRREKFGRELEEEMRLHREMKERELLADLARERGGERVSREDAREARYAAARAFGNATLLSERGREAWGGRWLEDVAQDLRLGVRMLRKNPATTTVIILTLTVGIGANAALFSVVNAVLLKPLPYDDPRTLVWMYCKRTDRARAPFSIADFEDYQKQNRSLKAMAAFSIRGANLTGDGFPKRLQGIKVTGGFFETVGVQPFLGRRIEPRDEAPDAAPVVVLTHRLWQDGFGRDAGIVGRAILLNGSSYKVIGVLPPGFFFPQRDAEMASQLNLIGDSRRADRGDRFLRAIGRLRGGVPPEQAESDLTTIAEGLRRQYPGTNDKNTGVRAFAMDQELIGNLRTALVVLSAAVATVLLLACANLAHLLLARFSLRDQEMAVRRVLGATRGRLARQLLVESCLFAACGGFFGVLFARWCVPLLLRISPAQVRDLGRIEVDGKVLLFVLAASVAAVLLFGLGPALLATGRDPNESIKGAGTAAGVSAAGTKVRKILVVLEAGLAVVLVSGAGLFTKSFARLAQVDPGFDARGVLAMRVSLPPQRYGTTQSVTSFEQRLKPQLQAIPGVQAAGVISSLPLSGAWAAVDFTIVGRPPLKTSEMPSAQYRVVSPGYFEAMAIPTRSGRLFTEDDQLETRPVAVINQTLAARFWPDANPIGAHLKLGGYSPSAGDAEIVGIVGNVKHLELDAEPTFDVYVPLRQASKGYLPYLVNGMWWVVRGSTDPDALATPVREAVQSADLEVATSRVAALERLVEDAAALRRFDAWVAGMFGAAALLLAVLGIYGVMAFNVAQRRREIGLRMVFGAKPSSVLQLVIVQGMASAGCGIAAGVLASFAFGRWISGLLYGVSGNDMATLYESAIVLLGVALAACYLPARRATGVSPMETLRQQ